MGLNVQVNDCCSGCVYFPPNLPRQAYSTEDFAMLQEKNCAFDFTPGDDHCSETRKTSCSLVDLQNMGTKND